MDKVQDIADVLEYAALNQEWLSIDKLLAMYDIANDDLVDVMSSLMYEEEYQTVVSLLARFDEFHWPYIQTIVDMRMYSLFETYIRYHTIRPDEAALLIESLRSSLATSEAARHMSRLLQALCYLLDDFREDCDRTTLNTVMANLVASGCEKAAMDVALRLQGVRKVNEFGEEGPSIHYPEAAWAFLKAAMHALRRDLVYKFLVEYPLTPEVADALLVELDTVQVTTQDEILTRADIERKIDVSRMY